MLQQWNGSVDWSRADGRTEPWERGKKRTEELVSSRSTATHVGDWKCHETAEKHWLLVLSWLGYTGENILLLLVHNSRIECRVWRLRPAAHRLLPHLISALVFKSSSAHLVAALLWIWWALGARTKCNSLERAQIKRARPLGAGRERRGENSVPKEKRVFSQEAGRVWKTTSCWTVCPWLGCCWYRLKNHGS